MCIACELGFWMAMDEEAPPAPVKRKAADFACDAPEREAPAKPRRTARKPSAAARRRAVRTSKVSAARE